MQFQLLAQAINCSPSEQGFVGSILFVAPGPITPSLDFKTLLINHFIDLAHALPMLKDSIAQIIYQNILWVPVCTE